MLTDCFPSLFSGGWWFAVTLMFCLCSVLSKEQGITVVAVCVTYEFFVLYKVNNPLDSSNHTLLEVKIVLQCFYSIPFR